MKHTHNPAQAVYEYVAFRQRGTEWCSWEDAPADVKAEYEQVAEIAIAVSEGRKPKLRVLSPVEA